MQNKSEIQTEIKHFNLKVYVTPSNSNIRT